MSELTIIIPVYNEQESIRNTIKEVDTCLPNELILAVNDGSTDSTLNILEELKKEHPNLQVISQQNKGYGGALATGFMNAKTIYVGFLDADLTYPPNYFPEMLEIIKNEDLDMIIGNRFGGKNNNMLLLRKIGNAIIRYFFLLWTGKYLDATSGMRIFKIESILSLKPETLPTGLDMITALSKRAVRNGLRFKLLPIHYNSRRGSSKLNVIKDFIRMIFNIIKE